MTSHTPVLLETTISLLNPRPGEFFIDGTVGGGGHARQIIDRISPGGVFLAVDWDEEALRQFSKSISNYSVATDIRCVKSNYANLLSVLTDLRLNSADGLVIDLGFSSDQLEHSGRGFSFLKDEPLLMTYSNDLPPVRKLLHQLKENELADIIYEYGGERFSRRIAKAIKTKVKQKGIETSLDLANTVRGALPKSYERGRIDPATRTFQALRIYTNHELENLTKLLQDLPFITSGRAVIITFHSLEDRLVKNYFRDYVRSGSAELLNKKPLTATWEEIKHNPRSRSAKLRGIKFKNN